MSREFRVTLPWLPLIGRKRKYYMFAIKPTSTAAPSLSFRLNLSYLGYLMPQQLHLKIIKGRPTSISISMRTTTVWKILEVLLSLYLCLIQILHHCQKVRVVNCPITVLNQSKFSGETLPLLLKLTCVALESPRMKEEGTLQLNLKGFRFLIVLEYYGLLQIENFQCDHCKWR